MNKEESVVIGGIEYVPKSEVKEKIIQIGAENTIAGSCIGKFVIVRSRNEGINAGTVKAADETGVYLENSRRLYYHAPADKSMSWYEGVAVYGLSDNSRVSVTRDKVIIEDYSMTPCTEEAEKSIMEKTPNAQG